MNIQLKPEKLIKALTIVLSVVFFIPVLIVTIKSASPYLQADDWRFVVLYLEPLYSGNFSFKLLWSDPVHPLPVYAVQYIISTKLFNLQIHYIAWFSIFFQLLLAYFINKSVIRSLKENISDRFVLIPVIIGINTYIFSFIGNQTYFWPIMTHCLIGLTLVFLCGYYADHYFMTGRIRKPQYKAYLIQGLIIIISILLFSDWTIIFCTGILLLLIFIVLSNKLIRKPSLKIALTILTALILGILIMEIFFIKYPRISNSSLTGAITLIISNFCLDLKAMAMGLFSGVINLHYLTRNYGLNPEVSMAMAIVFGLVYLAVLIIYLLKRYYEKSLLPPAMMLFSLLYLLSVVMFRYNPVDKGEFCLIVPRYVIFYQVGIIGFFWAVYLLFANIKERKNLKCKKLCIIILTLVLFFNWFINYLETNRTANYLRTKYPEVSQNIRKKLTDPSVEAWWSNQPGRDISGQLDFIHKHKLNVFAPNYPFPEKDTTDIFNQGQED